MKKTNPLNNVLSARNVHMANPIEMVTVYECRYCDHTQSHRPYGMDDVAVCMGCGAEWTPVAVQYRAEEIYGVQEDNDMDVTCMECDCVLNDDNTSFVSMNHCHNCMS